MRSTDLTLALAIVSAVLSLAGGCKRSEIPLAPPLQAVTVACPVSQEVIEWDEFTGHLDAVESVDLRARVSGLIMSAPFQEGAIVKQGDLLIEIDVRPFQAEFDSRTADETKSAAQVELAEIELNRIKSIPQEARTSFEYDTAAASLRQAQAVLAAAKAAVAAAQLNVEWCRVTAPISGRIGRKHLTSGNLISGGGGQGTLLTTITSVEPIYCYIDADERSVLKYAQMARAGTRLSAREARIPCFLQLADETGFPHEGVVDFVDNRVDPTTGTIRGRGVFPNPSGWLLPGFFARVRIPGSGRYQALLVPDSAVTTDQDQKMLLVVDPDDTVQPRPVKLGALFGELRAIESGIDANDRVIINGLMQARSGTKVNPCEGSIPLDSLSAALREPIQADSASATSQHPPASQRSEP